MSRHIVRHVSVKEGQGFDLADGERVISAEFDAPWFYLVLLLEDPSDNDGPVSCADGSLIHDMQGQPVCPACGHRPQLFDGRPADE